MIDDKRSEKDVFTKLNIIIFSYMILVYIFQNTIDIICSNYFQNIVNSEGYPFMVTVVGDYIMALPIFIFLLRKVPIDSLPTVKKLSFIQLIQGTCILILLVYILSSLRLVFSGLVVPQAMISPEMRFLKQSNIYFDFVFAVVMAPIKEEIIFRHLILDRVRKYGNGFAIIYTALVFGLGHGDIFQSFYAFGLGIIFGFIVVKTNRLIYAILAHSVANLFPRIAYLCTYNERFFWRDHNIFLFAYGLLIIIIIAFGLIFLIKKRKSLKLQDNMKDDKKYKLIVNKGFLLILMFSLMRLFLI